MSEPDAATTRWLLARRRLLAIVALGGGGAVAGLFLAELALFMIGDPAQLTEPVANPPNYSMQVDNVEFSHPWQTNSQGLRYREVPLRKPDGVTRIFVVGDSFVDGEGVETEHRFTELLETEFGTAHHPVEWINGGLGGQGVLQYARLFHWVGLRYRPDALLICVNANDLADVDPTDGPDRIHDVVIQPSGSLSRAFRTVWPRVWGRWRRVRDHWSPAIPDSWDLERFDPQEVVALARAQGIPEARIRLWLDRLPADWVAEAARGRIYSYLLSWGLLRPDFYTLAHDVAGPQAEQRWRSMGRVLDAMVGEARRRGIDVAMVLLPGPYLYDARLYDSAARAPFHSLGGTVRPAWASETTEIQRRLRGWADERGLPFLDLTEAFRRAAAEGTRLGFPIDGHWNEVGHRVAAERIARWVREERTLGLE